MCKNMTNLFIIEMVSLSESDVQWVVAIFPHQLIQVLSDVIHFSFALFINQSLKLFVLYSIFTIMMIN